MAYKFLSYDEAAEMSDRHALYDDLDIRSEHLFGRTCDLPRWHPIMYTFDDNKPRVHLFISDESLKGDMAGYLVEIEKNCLKVWLAKTYAEGHIKTEGPFVCTIRRDAGYEEVLEEIDKAINTCPACNKPVPYKNQILSSTYVRCCKDCLPGIKKQYALTRFYYAGTKDSYLNRESL